MFSTQKRIKVSTEASTGRKDLMTTTASMGFPGGGGMSMGLGGAMSGNTSITTNGSGLLNNLDTMMIGLMPEDEQSLLRFYRDIYNFDVIGGSAVDLMSTLPFSEFSLMGGDEKELDVFYKNIENLNINTLLPDMTVEFYTTGKFTGTMLYDEKKNEFADIIPHSPENLNIIPSPLYAGDPLIVSRVSNEMRQFLHSRDPHFEKLRERIPQGMIRAMTESQNVVLDPLMTLFLPRRTSTRGNGTSIYKRLIPIYLLEKVLYRGTITEANKRQRATMHLAAGSEFWEPQDLDLQMLTALFQQADLDPLGAIIATRNDITVNEIRAGGDFWKWTDILDVTTSLKLKALGVSDAFLSGEANWNTADAALSVFLEQLRAYRDMVTQKMFYSRIFPIISTMNGFKADGHARRNTMASGSNYPLSSGDNGAGMPFEQSPQSVVNQGRMDTSTLPRADTDLPIARIMRKKRNQSDLLIPEIHWHKQLRPEADREYLDVLNTLSEHGVPITLRAWAAAGGVSIEHLTEELKEDILLRKQISDLVNKHNPGAKVGETLDDEGNVENEEEENEAFATLGKVMSYFSGQRRIPLLARNFGEHAEAFDRTKTGKKKHVIHGRVFGKKQNEVIAKSLKRLSDTSHYEDVRKKNDRQKRKNRGGS